MTKQDFKRLWQHVEDEPTHYNLSQLEKMSASSAIHKRLGALFIMRKQIGQGMPPAAFLSLARGLVSDADNHCRWQALIVLGEMVEAEPETVWQVVEEYGASDDADMRSGVACVLLEHLLEHHFAAYFPKVRQRIESGDAAFADTFSTCAKSGQAAEIANTEQFDRLKAVASKLVDDRGVSQNTMKLDDAFSALRLKNQPVPRPLRLPTPGEVSAAERDLEVVFHPDYRRFQLEASDVMCGVLEPGLVLPGLPLYIDLREIARRGWAVGIPRDALPFCRDNGNYYFLGVEGTVRYWDHDGGGESGREATFAEWILEDWLFDYEDDSD